MVITKTTNCRQLAELAKFAHFAAVVAGDKHGKRRRIANSVRRETREAPPQWRTNGENEQRIRRCATFATSPLQTPKINESGCEKRWKKKKAYQQDSKSRRHRQSISQIGGHR
ncbi:MAG: hypothetical protein ABI690_27705 [Chloroflexota bacterium]